MLCYTHYTLPVLLNICKFAFGPVRAVSIATYYGVEGAMIESWCG